MKKSIFAAALAVMVTPFSAHADLLKGNLTGTPENAAFETCYDGRRVVLQLQMSPAEWMMVGKSNEAMFIQTLEGLEQQRRYRRANMHRLSLVVKGDVDLGGSKSGMYQGVASVSQVMMARRHQGVIKSCVGELNSPLLKKL